MVLVFVSFLGVVIGIVSATDTSTSQVLDVAFAAFLMAQAWIYAVVNASEDEPSAGQKAFVASVVVAFGFGVWLVGAAVSESFPFWLFAVSAVLAAAIELAVERPAIRTMIRERFAD